ncbi:MAG TPA: FxsA family protein [Bacillota bacterium]|nr:FxsA family protein [Bacillota bacterium]
MRFILLLILIPAIEIGLFVWIGGKVGPWWVIGTIVLTGFAGVAIAKQQGAETIARMRQSMANHRVPAGDIVDGVCILIGAICLITPGFLTDIIGFIMVLPTTRRPFKHLIGFWFQKKLANRTFIYRK